MTTPLLRHVLFAGLWPVLGVAACQGCRSSGTATVPALAQAGEGAIPTVRLYLVTDLAGALEPCGCTKDQLGGLDHFGAWVQHERLHAPAEVVASAGPLFFMDDKLEGERADQDRIKAQAIARVMRGIGLAAFAPGTNDWSDGAAGLTSLAEAAGCPPVLETGKAVVRDISGVKVAFVGYGQSATGAGAASVEDVVKRGVEDAKAQGAEVLIALTAVGRGEAKRVADAVPELTAVVVGAPRSAGEANTVAPQGERVGDVLIAQGANHLQSVAMLDLFVREPLVSGHVIKFADGTGLELSRKREDLARRIDELHVKLSAWSRDPRVDPGDVAARRQELASLEAQRDALDARPAPAHGSFLRYSVKEIRDSLGKDPTIEAEMVTYYRAVNDHNRAAFADRLPPPKGPDQASYVGTEACTSCHPGPREVWGRTAHAHAYATLSQHYTEFNLECVGCHVTGYEQPGGSTVTHVDKLENVGCEVCHGPGSKHLSNPADKSGIIARPQASRCLDCHHPPHVEGFDALAKMREILGPGHGMPR